MRAAGLLGTAAMGLAIGLLPALAQQPAPGTTPAAKAAKSSQTARPAGSAASKSDSATDAQPKTGDAALRQRIEQLEEQLTDMQVAIGTLDSLGRGGSAASAPGYVSRPPSGGGADSARLDGLEGQLRAMNGKLDQLADRIRALEGSAAAPAARGGAADIRRPEPAPTASAPLQRPDARPVASSASGGFGSVTVSPGEGQQGDDIGRLLNRETAGGDVNRGQLPAPGADGGGKQLYEQAYGFMLQQDYASAETAFSDFLQRYGNDPLAGNAQYWLGETYFVRGQFKPAASAFLKGYQTYSRSQKAPDSLLKLAMSLHRLGQKEAACSSFDELNTKFPAAPTHVKNRAQTERQRAGC